MSLKKSQSVLCHFWVFYQNLLLWSFNRYTQYCQNNKLDMVHEICVWFISMRWYSFQVCVVVCLSVCVWWQLWVRCLWWVPATGWPVYSVCWTEPHLPACHRWWTSLRGWGALSPVPHIITGLILGLHPANEWRRYFVTASPIGCA